MDNMPVELMLEGAECNLDMVTWIRTARLPDPITADTVRRFGLISANPADNRKFIGELSTSRGLMAGTAWLIVQTGCQTDERRPHGAAEEQPRHMIPMPVGGNDASVSAQLRDRADSVVARTSC